VQENHPEGDQSCWHAHFIDSGVLTSLFENKTIGIVIDPITRYKTYAKPSVAYCPFTNGRRRLIIDSRKLDLPDVPLGSGWIEEDRSREEEQRLSGAPKSFWSRLSRGSCSLQ